mmetsp:Transcript_27415/g.29922  ORF Transcript_27415/g.29922 Transcript_27415/m.29922 type:complete len:129 (+) Transcript_27415:471-857(+)
MSNMLSHSKNFIFEMFTNKLTSLTLSTLLRESFRRIHSLSSPLIEFQQHLNHQIDKIHNLDLHLKAQVTGSDLILSEHSGLSSLSISNTDRYAIPFNVVLPHSLDCLKLKGPFSSFPSDLSQLYSEGK